MKIHTYKSGESIKDIAKKYGISEECLRECNNIPSGEAAIGEELLIIVPTRTYTVARGDSLERLCLRFGVRRIDILAQNPWVSECGLTPGKTLNLKCGERLYGTAPTNGYIYRGYDPRRLQIMLPYLTYVTVGCATAESDNIRFDFDDGELVDHLKREAKIPLLRIYDKSERRDYSSQERRLGFADRIVEAASSHGYMGVVISACNVSGGFGDYGEFLCGLRKAMIGCDLILVTEVDASTPADICELADGNILSHPKYITDPKQSFEQGEKKCYLNHATSAESAKTFIDIPSLAYAGGGFVPIEDALLEARAHGAEIVTDEITMISHFENKKRGRYDFPSLSSIKSTYEILNEYGFIGASFDVSRTPVSHLLMYNAYFRTATATTARVVEGCAKRG